MVMYVNDTTEIKGKAYEWVRKKGEISKARISYILSEQLKGHYPTAEEVIKNVSSDSAFFAVGTLLHEGLENGTLKREESRYFINEEVLPEVKKALGME